MAQRKRKLVMIVGGAMVSLVALALFVYRLQGHWESVLEAFLSSKYRYIAPSIAFLALAYILRIVRWHVFMRPIACVKWFNATSATIIGFAANNIIPARLGELIRPYLLCRREDMDFSHAFSTVGLARLFDLMGLSILLLMAGFMVNPAVTTIREVENNRVRTERYGQSEAAGEREDISRESELAGGREVIHTVWSGGVIVSVIAFIVMASLFLMVLWPTYITGCVRCMTRLLPGAWPTKVEAVFASLLEGLNCLKSWRGVCAAFLLSVSIWAFQALSTLMVAWSMELDVGPGAILLVTIGVAAAVAIPQAPGFLGTFHLAAALVVEGFEVGKGQAGAFAMVMWLVNIIPVTLVGVGFLIVEGMNLRKLEERSQKMKERDGDEFGE